ncbi:MAG: ABC transporter ATP-binding protein [Lachnospiraceae bacterium]|nr:ABC transporter ATP-binding protein [Lachnospiraceae bacterium]
MIEIKNISKSYDDISALGNLTINMREGEVFGLVGTNGAGKSTLLRIMAGVLKADCGEVIIDGEQVYDNPLAKELLYMIPDDPYYFPNATANEMMNYYGSVYKNFDYDKFQYLLQNFNLSGNRKIATFSKGMRKQLAILLGISSNTKYLFCDETFDGLDPVMRQAAKMLFAREMDERGLTPILTSHNLRELEDICDHVGLLHKGGVLLSKDLVDMKLNIQKVQVVYKSVEEQRKAESTMNILIHEQRGKVHVYTVRMSLAELEISFEHVETLLFESLPLTLEEIFISETEVVGYDIKNIIQG